MRGAVIAGPCGGPPEGLACSAGNDANHVFIATTPAGEAGTADHSFYIAVIG